MKTIKEWSEELYKENNTLWEDKEYWKKLAEKRKGQLQQKENIIKEVREYIEKHIAIFKGGNMLVDMNIDELLEILGKEVN